MESAEFTNKVSEYIQNLVKDYLANHKNNISDFIAFRQEVDEDTTFAETQAKRYTDFLFIIGGFLSCLLLWIGRFTYRKLKSYYNGRTTDNGIVIGPYNSELSEPLTKVDSSPVFNTAYHEVTQQIKNQLLKKAGILNKDTIVDIEEPGRELFRLNHHEATIGQKKKDEATQSPSSPPPPPIVDTSQQP